MTNTKEFVSHVRNHLKEYGFSLIFGKGRRVNINSSRCEGYFSTYPKKEIRVAKKQNGWLDVLAHEYCHFLQWLDKSNIVLESEDSAGYIVHKFATGYLPKKYSKSKIDKAFIKIAQMERDCEQRTIEIIKKWNLPINKELYIRRANLYIYLHHMWKIHRTLKTKFNPNSSRRILAKMPTTFKAHSHTVIPNKVKKELTRCFE